MILNREWCRWAMLPKPNSITVTDTFDQSEKTNKIDITLFDWFWLADNWKDTKDKLPSIWEIPFIEEKTCVYFQFLRCSASVLNSSSEVQIRRMPASNGAQLLGIKCIASGTSLCAHKPKIRSGTLLVTSAACRASCGSKRPCTESPITQNGDATDVVGDGTTI